MFLKITSRSATKVIALGFYFKKKIKGSLGARNLVEGMYS